MTLDDGCINEEGNVGPAPRVCLDCHGELMRATDVYVVVCVDCGEDFVVGANNDYLAREPAKRA